ncbi:MAG: anthranilate phosphoribosyltransferase [Bacillota bacterium]|nr:anthranilate phosphoribosyltransferase [Bacillota bacterium]
MTSVNSKTFGAVIGRLIDKQNLSRKECRAMFEEILTNSQTEMQQGAFLSALAAKGETVDEIAGAWEAIFEFDTVTAGPFSNDEPLVDNCGTGMDSFKTFNISTAASVIAAAAGAKLARHGARAITSTCGTVDLAEALGVDVECGPNVVVDSIEKVGLGLFNGTSPTVHPRALGRILSQISFGTVLNIAASLANPARPAFGVRGVCSPALLEIVPPLMREIGYRKALIVNGLVGDSGLSMDEASTLGETLVAELEESGEIKRYRICPAALGIKKPDSAALKPSPSISEEAWRMVTLLAGEGCPDRTAVAALNAALVLKVAGLAADINEGYAIATETVRSGKAYAKLTQWVGAQNEDPDRGLKRLSGYLAQSGGFSHAC